MLTSILIQILVRPLQLYAWRHLRGTIISLLKLKPSYYDQVENAGQILAWYVKQLKSERVINAIQIEGKMTAQKKKCFLNVL